MMMLIAAMSQNRVIGVNNQLPWHLPNDLKHFKSVTMGKTIVMGRKTFESIGKPLPGRRNVVLTRDLEWKAPCETLHTIESVLSMAETEDVCVIGGAEIYAQCMPFAQELFLTQIEVNLEGDAYFPEIDVTQWKEVLHEKHAQDDKHAFGYSFLHLKKIL